jgi:hypothetical protein
MNARRLIVDAVVDMAEAVKVVKVVKVVQVVTGCGATA